MDKVIHENIENKEGEKVYKLLLTADSSFYNGSST